MSGSIHTYVGHDIIRQRREPGSARLVLRVQRYGWATLNMVWSGHGLCDPES